MYDTSKDIDVSWIIERSKLPQYKRKLPTVLSPEDYSMALRTYFQTNVKYNIYTLATHVGMSKRRFEAQYKNSPDPLIKEMTEIALDMIAGHAMANEEDYRRTLKYILSYSETGKNFIELSQEMADLTAGRIIQLPQKDLK
jgi:hypothetical protein